MIAILACAMLTLIACSGGGGTAQSASAAMPETTATGAAFTPVENVVLPDANMGYEGINADHLAQGYVVASQSSAARLKFQVAKGEMAYNYDLPNDGTPTVFPVNMGDGDYRFRIMKNTDGNNYAEIDAVETYVTLDSEFAPFLTANQFSWYTADSKCVAKASELTAGADNQGQALQGICEYLIKNVSYDTAKAEQLSKGTGYIPNPDETLATGKGICFDYASLGAAMLRSVGFPTKLVTGYVAPGDLYHAWIMVYVDGEWKTVHFTVSPNEWSRVDLTFASSGGSKYTGDGTEYTDRYVY